jgi:hypothetical protein
MAPDGGRGNCVDSHGDIVTSTPHAPLLRRLPPPWTPLLPHVNPSDTLRLRQNFKIDASLLISAVLF